MIMLTVSPDQLAQITASCFFVRLSRFLSVSVRSSALREQVAKGDDTFAFWHGLWPQVQTASEHDAAVFLTFMLASHVEGLDLHRACHLAKSGGELAEVSMKRFLSDRGHLRFSDFDFTEQEPSGQES